MSEESKLYTLPEAAKQLAISYKTLKRRIDDGLLLVVYPSERCPRISQAEIARYVADLSANADNQRRAEQAGGKNLCQSANKKQGYQGAHNRRTGTPVTRTPAAHALGVLLELSTNDKRKGC